MLFTAQIMTSHSLISSFVWQAVSQINDVHAMQETIPQTIWYIALFILTMLTIYYE